MSQVQVPGWLRWHPDLIPGLPLIMINSMELTMVASLGSATSLMVYFLVNLGAFKVIDGSVMKRTLIFLSVLGCLDFREFSPFQVLMVCPIIFI